MNESCHNLNFYGKSIYDTYKEYIHFINKSHDQIKQKKSFDWVYNNFKRYERDLLK